MKPTSNKVLKAAAIASLLAGGAVAGSFINAESAQAQTANSQSRVSGALTSVLTNGVTNSFAAEIVYPQNDYVSSGTVSMSVTYAPVGTGAASDASQYVITAASMTGSAVTYSANTVEAATARAIGTAVGASRYGDVTGIVKSFQSGGLD
ncbi:MAG: hypothetical protein RLZZ29_2040 [Cyanobacteriota bacterium]|jgi:hypothetical protein